MTDLTNRMEISGTLLQDAQTIQTLPIRQTYTFTSPTMVWIKQIDITLQQIPSYSSPSSFVVTTAQFNANPSKYMASTTASFTWTKGGGRSWTARLDWSQFDKLTPTSVWVFERDTKRG